MERLYIYIYIYIYIYYYQELDGSQYIGKNLYLNRISMRSLYGGQVMGQALKVAYLSMADLASSFVLQSLHCYFISPLQTSPDIVYKAEHVKIGSNFRTVVVSAIQNSKVGFYCMVSFQREQAGSREIDYCTKEMPEVPRPREGGQAGSEDQHKGKFKLVRMVKERVLDVCACVKRNIQVPSKPK